MRVIFNNGTAQQQAWFTETIARSLYPWDRITTTVHVAWVAFADLPRHHNDFAATVWTATPADPCGRPDTASIQIRDDLDDPHRLGTEGGQPRGHFAGKKFYMETVHHELGHVVQAKFSGDQQARMSAVFGGGPDDWNGPAKWEEKRQESDAETFKDVWLPGAYRKFDNRTLHRLQREQFDTYLGVLDNVCPCAGTLLTSDGGGGGTGT